MKFNLRNILWDKRLTQCRFCEMTGLSPGYINALYNNRTTRIELDKLKKICDALNITPNDLIIEG